MITALAPIRARAPISTGPKILAPSANVDVVADPGNAGPTSCADRNLLEYQAINADFGLRMNHDTVGMWNEKASADIAG